MVQLNYHHLKLFWAVAREGNLTRASAGLNLTPQTVSKQLKDLQDSLGETLFRRSGRNLVLTEAGQVVQQYADEIFTLGKELTETLHGQRKESPLRLKVGIADVLPKRVVHRLIEPALRLGEPVRIKCLEGPSTKLLAALATHELDVVLADAPIPPAVKIQGFNHLLGACGVSLMAHPDLAATLREGFPQSLDGAPALFPSEDAVLRRELDDWFNAQGVVPMVVGEFDDSALLKVFGQAGTGFFAVPSVIAQEVAREYGVTDIGSPEGITERFYAISAERRVRNPAVVAICAVARAELFASE